MLYAALVALLTGLGLVIFRPRPRPIVWDFAVLTTPGTDFGSLLTPTGPALDFGEF